MEEFVKNYNWILSLFVQIFIAYHILSLTLRSSKKSKLEHKKEIREKIDELITEVYVNKSRNHGVMIIDLDNLKKYPDGGCIKAEIKATRYEGVEFLLGNSNIFQTKKGKLTLKGSDNKLIFETYDVGVLPYEWIENVELKGDDFNSCAQIYCHFKKYNPCLRINPLLFKFKNIFKQKSWKYFVSIRFFDFTPFKNVIYFKKNKNYQVGRNYYWEEFHELFNKSEMKDIKIK